MKTGIFTKWGHILFIITRIRTLGCVCEQPKKPGRTQTARNICDQTDGVQLLE